MSLDSEVLSKMPRSLSLRSGRTKSSRRSSGDAPATSAHCTRQSRLRSMLRLRGRNPSPLALSLARMIAEERPAAA
jgi:hypothetical protein